MKANIAVIASILATALISSYQYAENRGPSLAFFYKGQDAETRQHLFHPVRPVELSVITTEDVILTNERIIYCEAVVHETSITMHDTREVRNFKGFKLLCDGVEYEIAGLKFEVAPRAF